jgi:hypothetical protein
MALTFLIVMFHFFRADRNRADQNDASYRQRVCLAHRRLHFVTHRLALGHNGLKELVAAERRIFGFSELDDSATLSVFDMPVMDFEKGGMLTSSLSIVAHTLCTQDSLVKGHIEVCFQDVLCA